MGPVCHLAKRIMERSVSNPASRGTNGVEIFRIKADPKGFPHEHRRLSVPSFINLVSDS